MHFFSIMFYIVMLIFSFVNYLSFIGLAIQDGIFPEYYHSGSEYSYEMTVLVIILSQLICLQIMFEVFFFPAIFIAFKSYKEFKGMLYDHMGMGGNHMPFVND
jgi:hypothetical protein